MQENRSGAAVGYIMFASFILIMIGIFHAIDGLAAIVNNNFYVPLGDYVFKFNVTTWGWIHLIGGIIILLAGFSLYGGAIWARTVGVIVALISAIASFASLPYYPIWSIIIIILDVCVIWALTLHGRDATA
ncbi:MAG TPA: hypothetical protein VGJ67_00205 [Actinomycetota bacterium]|jgi:hypothetical protein